MSVWKNTGIICLINVPDLNREEGFRPVDVGNYFEDKDGNKMVLMTNEYAEKYKDFINVPVYTRRTK